MCLCSSGARARAHVNVHVHGHTSFTRNDQFAVTQTFRRRPRNAGNSDQTFPFPGTFGRARLHGLVFNANKTQLTVSIRAILSAHCQLHTLITLSCSIRNKYHISVTSSHTSWMRGKISSEPLEIFTAKLTVCCMSSVHLIHSSEINLTAYLYTTVLCCLSPLHISN